MRALVFLVPFVIFSMATRADENQTIEGSCGDHWYSISFHANTRTKEVKLSLSGDSGVNGEFTGTLVKDENDPSFKIEFNTPEKGYLYIDGSDYYHNIYWGTISRTGNPEDSQGLGLCSITQ